VVSHTAALVDDDELEEAGAARQACGRGGHHGDVLLVRGGAGGGRVLGLDLKSPCEQKEQAVKVGFVQRAGGACGMELARGRRKYGVQGWGPRLTGHIRRRRIGSVISRVEKASGDHQGHFCGQVERHRHKGGCRRAL
jgi:hypothetical protein